MITKNDTEPCILILYIQTHDSYKKSRLRVQKPSAAQPAGCALILFV